MTTNWLAFKTITFSRAPKEPDGPWPMERAGQELLEPGRLCESPELSPFNSQRGSQSAQTPPTCVVRDGGSRNKRELLLSTHYAFTSYRKLKFKGAVRGCH